VGGAHSAHAAIIDFVSIYRLDAVGQAAAAPGNADTCADPNNISTSCTPAFETVNDASRAFIDANDAAYKGAWPQSGLPMQQARRSPCIRSPRS
jgi:hypothetical protein